MNKTKTNESNRGHEEVNVAGKEDRASSDRLASAQEKVGKRRIIGISGDQQVCLVLCDDGSVWKSQIYGAAEVTWQQLPELPQELRKTVKGEGHPAVQGQE